MALPEPSEGGNRNQVSCGNWRRWNAGGERERAARASWDGVTGASMLPTHHSTVLRHVRIVGCTT